jgi:hypothetical protein
VKNWVHESNREFSKEEVQMTSKYMKKCSTFLAVREMQIKTTLIFHLIPVRMAIFNSKNTKCWQGFEETGTLIHYWWGCKLVQLW